MQYLRVSIGQGKLRYIHVNTGYNYNVREASRGRVGQAWDMKSMCPLMVWMTLKNVHGGYCDKGVVGGEWTLQIQNVRNWAGDMSSKYFWSLKVGVPYGSWVCWRRGESFNSHMVGFVEGYVEGFGAGIDGTTDNYWTITGELMMVKKAKGGEILKLVGGSRNPWSRQQMQILYIFCKRILSLQAWGSPSCLRIFEGDGWWMRPDLRNGGRRVGLTRG